MVEQRGLKYDKRAVHLEARRYDQLIGRRLRQARTKAKLTQQQLGRALGLSFQSIQRYEQGLTPIGSGRLVQAAARLDLLITYPFQDLIDFDGFTTVAREDGSDRVPPLSLEAYRLARNFDAIKDAQTRECLLTFLHRLTLG